MDRLLPWKVAAVVAILTQVVANDALHAQGQALAVTGDQDLQFGAVLPGLATPVSPTDVANAARFEIRGGRDSEVVVQISLPSEMMTPGGAALTLAYGAADGRWSAHPSIRKSWSFDPSLPLVSQLSRSGRLYIWIGGTAQPLPAQVPGDYTAAINVTVAYTGNK